MTASQTDLRPARRRKPKSLDGVEMDIDEFMALPDDGSDRWLIDGKVVEFAPAGADGMTVRSEEHALGESSFASALRVWRRSTNFPGRVRSGEVGTRLNPASKSLTGIDIAVFSADTPREKRGGGRVFVGPPLVAVEVLSSSDKMTAVNRKIQSYLDAGTPLVMLADPFRREIHVHRGSDKPLLLRAGDTLGGFDVLPGFSIPVAEVFEE